MRDREKQREQRRYGYEVAGEFDQKLQKAKENTKFSAHSSTVESLALHKVGKWKGDGKCVSL